MLLNQTLPYNTSPKKKFKKLQMFKKLKFTQVNNLELNLLAANLAWTDMSLLIVFIHLIEGEHLNIHTFHCAWFWMLLQTLRDRKWSCSVVSHFLQPHGLYSPACSSVHGIFQARVLEWVAISFSRGSSRPRDWTRFSALQADALPSEPPGKPLREVPDKYGMCTHGHEHKHFWILKPIKPQGLDKGLWTWIIFP